MSKEQALAVVETLERHGYQAYFVGGCVRDWLLARPVHDIDICTDARPSDVMRLFPDCVPTGLKHGTVSVKQGPYLFEVTTFRTESEYLDYRRPQSVVFVGDVREDLARRDFTINAMAMDKNGVLIDPFGGRDDLERQVIRAVGDARTRFQEDALRILRAARFAAKLNFAVDPETKRAMRDTAPLLAHIAVERVRDELQKLLDSDTPQTGVRVIVETDLFAAFPDLGALFADSAAEVWRLPRLGSVTQKWSLLFHAAGMTLDDTRRICRMLKMSNRETGEILRFAEALSELQPQWDTPAEPDWPRWLIRRGWMFCLELDTILSAIWLGKRDREASHRLIDAYRALPVKSPKELAVTGRDLAEALGRAPGAWISRTLEALFKQTALHGLPNTREALLAAARKEVENREHQTGDFEGVSE